MEEYNKASAEIQVRLAEKERTTEELAAGLRRLSSDHVGGGDPVIFATTNTGRIVEIRPPVKPEKGDCCGNGCVPCVLDLYARDVEDYREQLDRVRQGLPPRLPEDDQRGLAQEPSLSPREYRSFEVLSITPINPADPSCRVLQCRTLGGRPLGVALGQHVFLRAEVNGETVTRPYTPVTGLGKDHTTFGLVVKTYSGTKMNDYMDKLEAGHSLQLRGPIGEFSYAPNKWKRVIMLGGGSGVVPMIQIARGIVLNEKDDTFVNLLYSEQTPSKIILRSEIETLADYWNFTRTFFLTQMPEAEAPQKSYMAMRRIQEEDIKALTKGSVNKTLVLICGKVDFNVAMNAFALHIGFPPESIRIFQ